eukprot:TRINITY_DN7038_c0_g1_i1.p1 TRINITY_DN7038_c0_g1~~TRINITY_DN7038_c0_g1_i1.p1  ORF type:complete len:321 (-),score=42.67 TRINITY_DN7038_c0_g1_i1:116-1078(-)
MGTLWSVTDTDLMETENGPLMLYTSLNSVAHIVNPISGTDTPFDLSQFPLSSEQKKFLKVLAMKFSSDGSEVIAGCTNGGLCIYDLMNSKMSAFCTVHTNDVNTVAWDSKGSSSIIYSGGDDCMIFVWDRRTVGQSQKPVGVLIGHQEGITHVASQGDSVHLLSNGKDQVMKYWDIRKTHELSKIEGMPPLKRKKDFDYRFGEYNEKETRHALDCSVRDFSGHSVLATLIRCDFSPRGITAQRYVYTGSSDGVVHVYELENPRKVKRLTANRKGIQENEMLAFKPVRDVSWHPKYPLLIATSFSGNLIGWKCRLERIKTI